MNCDEIRPLLSAYIDGEASPEETARVQRHLATCDDCRQVLAEYRAIGGGLRAMPLPVPPAGLRRDVWRAIEAGNRHNPAGVVRSGAGAGISVLRGGKAEEQGSRPATRGWGISRILPAAGIAAVMLLALTVVLLLTNRNTVQAAGLREKSPLSDYSQTLHIEFSRVVDPNDVVANTHINEINGDTTQRLPDNALQKSYDKQARVLSISPNQQWTAGQDYEVVVDAENIGTGVKGQYLDKKPITLSFSALAYTPTATSTSTSTPTATPTKKATQTPQPTNTPEPTVVAQSPVVPPPAGSPTTQPAPSDTPAPTNTATHVQPTATYTDTPTPTDTRTPEPTHTTVPPTATGTLTSTPSVTPGRKATGTPTPRTTGTPTPRASATPTPWNACSIQPVNGFGKLWSENASVRSKLGCPSAHELGIQLAAEQHFQGGYMFWRGDTKTVYVFLGGNTGEWYDLEDTWQDSDPTPAPLGNAPAGLYEPVRGFGKIWRDYPSLKQALGWATDEETNVTAAWEAFTGGNTIWVSSTKQIRVMYDAGNRYETYLDTYGTPTPSVKKPAN